MKNINFEIKNHNYQNIWHHFNQIPQNTTNETFPDLVDFKEIVQHVWRNLDFVIGDQLKGDIYEQY